MIMKGCLYASLIFAVLVLNGCGGSQERAGANAGRTNAGAAGGADLAQLTAAMEAVRPLHKPLGEPQPGDWLTTYHEPGQTFQEYISSDPVTARGARRMLYIQPLGKFTTTQRKIVTLTAEYLHRFFDLPVKVLDDLPLSVVPPKARRRHPSWGMEQLLTTYITSEVLRPRLPEDAAALIAFTAADLYPGEEMNFVFGQASLRDRVGVWSLYRFGAPEASEQEFHLTLLRTMKLASHETGHMFSIQHCTKYECNMNGTNHLGETDRRPLDACPECMAKVCYATGYDPRKRYEQLADFCRANGFTAEQKFFEAELKALAAKSS